MSGDWDVMREDSETVRELLTSARLLSTPMCEHFDTNSVDTDSARHGWLLARDLREDLSLLELTCV